MTHLVTMSARERLQRMGEAYRSCRSYEDRGEVHVNGVLDGTFKTKFLRSSGKFSFEFDAGESMHYLVRAEENEILSEFRLPPTFPISLRIATRLDLALATIAGITAMSGHIVPRMLMPNVLGGRSICAVPNPTVLGEESFADEPCVWIEIGPEFPGVAVLVSTTDHTLRRYLMHPRVVDTAVLGNRSSVSKQPGPNVAVPEHAIAYAPRIRSELESPSSG